MNLIESIQQAKETRQEWMDQAALAERLLGELPKEIQELEGSADCDYTGKLKLDLIGGDAAIGVCQRYGVTFDKPQFSTYGGTFSINGSLGDTMIHIFQVDQPPECRVEKEEFTATRYKAICNETEEEV